MILVGNGPLITRDKNNPFIENGGLIIEGSRILKVGTWQAMKEVFYLKGWNMIHGSKVIDVRGKLIMPGLINAHHHIYSAYARGLSGPIGPTEKFEDILHSLWWKLDELLDKESTYYSGIATYIECIKNGVTTVFDHHASYGEITGSLKALKNAADLIGIRTSLCYEVSDRHGLEKANEAIAENFSFAKESTSMIQPLVGLHASFTLSDETLDQIKTLNQDGIGYHVHVSEAIEDEEQCQRDHGTSVVKRFNEYGMLNENSIAVHGIHVSEEDMDVLKDSGVYMAHNPASNMANAVGAANVIGLMAKGIPVCMGTDGYTSDILSSLKVANMLQKHSHKKGDVGFGEVIEMLFSNNSKLASQFFDNRVGEISSDSVADVTIMAYVPTTPLTKDNYDGHIMFGVDGAMTDTVIINGEVIYENRMFTQIDEAKLLEESRKAAEKVWSEWHE